MQIIPKEQQAYGAFNGGEIVENKPIGFPQEGGKMKSYSNLFYWAYAEAKVDSEIGLHPHRGFEIMSFVLKGSIRHYDTKLKEWRALNAGDAQIIRAGSGISHAEFMAAESAMFQIWLDPNLLITSGMEASYDDYKDANFPRVAANGITKKIFIGKDSPFSLTSADIEIEEWQFGAVQQAQVIDSTKTLSIYVLDGAFTMNGKSVQKDDFIIISNENQLNIDSKSAGKIFIISSPTQLTYPTYQQIMQQQMAK